MPAPSPDPAAVLRSRSYVGLLVLAAILGVPISAAAYGFLALVGGLQEWLFTDLPEALGLGGVPWWWPLPLLTLAGILVALTIRYLPGRGGHSPADGFQAGGVPSPVEVPGIAIAALATLSLGAVLGTRGAADRPRRRAGRVGGAPGQAGPTRSGHGGGGRGGQLRRHQHAPGIAPAGSAPAAGRLQRAGLQRVDGQLPGRPGVPGHVPGAAGGVALSHLPGLPLVPGVAMGIGAMCVVMLNLPMTSVLLATLLLASDGLAVMPLVIVAVAVAYVASARLAPVPQPAPTAAPPAGEPVQTPRAPVR
jgi:hypothetical protein